MFLNSIFVIAAEINVLWDKLYLIRSNMLSLLDHFFKTIGFSKQLVFQINWCPLIILIQQHNPFTAITNASISVCIHRYQNTRRNAALFHYLASCRLKNHLSDIMEKNNFMSSSQQCFYWEKISLVQSYSHIEIPW